MTGRMRSRSSAAFIRSVEGSSKGAPFVGSVAPGAGESRLACGVPSGGGEPATEDRGVNSLSSWGRRLRRLKGLGFTGVAIILAGSAGALGAIAEGRY
jgi:hypothetical protein